MDNNQQQALQEIIIDYFKEFDDDIIVGIIDSFVYHKPAKNEKISKVLENFLKDQGIEIAYINYISDFVKKEQTSFTKSNPSEIEIINNIKMAFLNLIYNRFRNNLNIKSEKYLKNKNRFAFLKNELLDIYSMLNRNEHYFYGKKEDEKLVNKITLMNYE